MAQAHLTREDVKALQSTRQALFQLSNTIQSLKVDFLRTSTMPDWTTIQAQSGVVGNNVQSVTELLHKHADLLNRTVVFPSTNFPGRTQEGLLTQLLRKKLEPQVETWVEEGRTKGQTEETGGKSEEEFLLSARDWFTGRAAKYAGEEASLEYTFDEIENGVENVNTGLKPDDVSDDEDEEMADAGVAPGGSARSLEDILRFATTGNVMTNVSNGRR
ncbi:uncharacterized protein PAC_16392 [Phialocephala subalpina]|uniref:Mediator of RNA polymerase II transcription subunit 8 n=1 Tax=Phialocephala subalpina TaxID=576137 RepID=A0A1L7XN55_9HELO|nr:uncharacterized protein PAC_16392 [Phialocephala subalpina]